MLSPKKYFSIDALMFLSQLLLTAFVCWWLIGQYKDEKVALHKDLLEKFADSKQQVMDSGLVSNFINPILQNKKGFKIHIERSDSLLGSEDLKIEEEKHLVNFPQRDTIVLIDKSQNQQGEKMITIKTQRRDSSKDALLHGVKLFIKEVTSDSANQDHMETTYYFNSDTLLFKKIVEQNWKNAGFVFPVFWVSNLKKDDSRIANEFYFESNLFSFTYGVQVKNFSFYLVRKIFPQLLFALFLLLISGSAFYLSYRSLKIQYQLNQLKNDFSNNMSHELKTPVSTIKVALEALQTEGDRANPAKVKEYLNMAALETERLDMLINKVLSVSQAEQGAALFHMEKINLVQSCKDFIDAQLLIVEKAEATLLFEYEVEPIYIVGDYFHLQGIINNLIDNSLKYASGTPHLELKLEENEKFVFLTFKDEGLGIPEEYLTKIFDKFFRIPSGDRHNVKGYGLGLSYVAFVMKQHKGKIEVKNNKEKGCTFYLQFPKA